MTHSTFNKKNEPRFKPVENPKSLKLKLVYWFIKRTMGKVVTPVKVNAARFPEGLGLSQKMAATSEKITIDSRLHHLLKTYVATINGCGFCIDIGKAYAQKNSVDPGIFDDLLRFEDSNQYSEAEKAALTYVDEVTRNKHVDDATFERLQQHFDEREIVQITMVNAIENFYNLMNAPLNIGSDELCELWA